MLGRQRDNKMLTGFYEKNFNSAVAEEGKNSFRQTPQTFSPAHTNIPASGPGQIAQVHLKPEIKQYFERPKHSRSKSNCLGGGPIDEPDYSKQEPKKSSGSAYALAQLANKRASSLSGLGQKVNQKANAGAENTSTAGAAKYRYKLAKKYQKRGDSNFDERSSSQYLKISSLPSKNKSNNSQSRSSSTAIVFNGSSTRNRNSDAIESSEYIDMSRNNQQHHYPPQQQQHQVSFIDTEDAETAYKRQKSSTRFSQQRREGAPAIIDDWTLKGSREEPFQVKSRQAKKRKSKSKTRNSQERKQPEVIVWRYAADASEPVTASEHRSAYLSQRPNATKTQESQQFVDTSNNKSSNQFVDTTDNTEFYDTKGNLVHESSRQAKELQKSTIETFLEHPSKLSQPDMLIPLSVDQIKEQYRRQESQQNMSQPPLAGIQPYQTPALWTEGSNQQIQMPLTSSQLADDFHPVDSKYFQQRLNRRAVFQYDHETSGVALSNQAQEVVLDEESSLRQAFEQIYKTQSYKDNVRVNDYNHQSSSQVSSSALNLANLQSQKSIKQHQHNKDQAHGSLKAQELERVRIQVRNTAFQKSKLEKKNEPEVGCQQDNKLTQEELYQRGVHSPVYQVTSPPQEPENSEDNNSYIRHIQRNRLASRSKERLDGGHSTIPEAKSVPKGQFVRHRSVENARQYCISKITGQLDTKRELAYVSKLGLSLGVVRQQVHARYEQVAKKNKAKRKKSQKSRQQQAEVSKSTPQVGHSRVESASSFAKRLEKFKMREEIIIQQKRQDRLEKIDQIDKEDRRPLSKLDLENNDMVGNFIQERRQVDMHEPDSPKMGYFGNGKPSQQPQFNRNDDEGVSRNQNQLKNSSNSSQKVPAYYTLGVTSGFQEQSTKGKIQPYQHHKNQDQPLPNHNSLDTSPLRNHPASLFQADYHDKMDQASQMKELMSRAQDYLDKNSQEDLITKKINDDKNAQGSVESQSELKNEQDIGISDSHLEEEQQQSRVSDYDQQQVDTAFDSNKGRIEELQRQTNEVQKLPDFYNERVMSLKKRTQELQEVALTYTSGEKDISHMQIQDQGRPPRLEDHRLPEVNNQMLITSDNKSAVQNYQDYLNQMTQKSQSKAAQTMNSQQEAEKIIQQQYERIPVNNENHVQVLSHQFSLADARQNQSNEFELTKKLDQHAYMHVSRTQENTQQTLTTDKGGDQDLIQKKERKQRRRQKREEKLLKLKELHELAQNSMNKIAQGLSSQSSIAQYQSASQHHLQTSYMNSIQREAVSFPDEPMVIGTNLFDDKRDSIRSQVEKLANTRKEIKKLIKIQNKHGKLLKKLQNNGVIPSEISNASQYNPSNPTLGTELSENTKDYQVAMSSHLLQQMQDVFKYLAKIQHQLDHEIQERSKRTDQLQKQNIINMGHYRNESQVLQQQNQPFVTSLQSQQQPSLYFEQQNLNANASQGTNSTLFWDTQMPQQHNGSGIFQGLQQQNPINPYKKQGSSQSSIPQEYQQNNSMGDTQKMDNKDVVVVKQQQELREPPMLTYATENDEQEEGILQQNDFICGGGKIMNTNTISADCSEIPRNTSDTLASRHANNTLMSGTGASLNLQGIRVEQLVEILGREIGLVREESTKQAQEMRIQYEQELQALREEFYAKTNEAQVAADVSQLYPSQNINVSTLQLTQTADQLQKHFYTDGNGLLTQQSASEEKNQRQSTGREQSQAPQYQQHQHYQEQQYQGAGSAQHLQNYLLSTPNEAQEVAHQVPKQIPREIQIQESIEEEGTCRTLQESSYQHSAHQEISQSVLKQIQKIKAERDHYYNKLIKLKQHMQEGRSKREQAIVNNQSFSGMSASIECQQPSQEAITFNHNNQRIWNNSHSGNPNQNINRRQTRQTTQSSQFQTDFIVHSQEQLHEQFLQMRQRNARSVNHIAESNLPSYNVEEALYPSQQQMLIQSSNQMLEEMHERSIRSIERSIERNRQIQSMPPQNVPQIHHGAQQTLETQQTIHNNNKNAKNQRQAGKIVHQQFRSLAKFSDSTQQQSKRVGDVRSGSQVTQQTSKTMHIVANNQGGDLCNNSSKYIQVRHNRSKSKLKIVKESLVQKCNSCLIMSSADDRGVQRTRSQLSHHSNSSVTRKNIQQNIGGIMSTLAGSKSISSNNECTNCQCKITEKAPRTPYGGVNAGDSASGKSSVSNHKTALMGHQRPSTNHDLLTFSNKSKKVTRNKSNSTLNSQKQMDLQKKIDRVPSDSIGGGQSIKSLVSRSPQLIKRLAAEHEIYLSNFAAQDSSEAMMEQTGGGCSESNTDHRASRALSKLSQYLARQDNKQTAPVTAQQTQLM